MKIRSHLLLLVATALLPLLAFAIGLTAYSWWQQRSALEGRQLERVRSTIVALDTELQASIRVLRVLGLSPGLDPSNLRDFGERMRGVLSTQPLWSAIAIGDPEWQRVVGVVPAGPLPYGPELDPGTRRRAVESRLPAVSPLVKSADGYVTHIAVPILQGEAVSLVLMVVIDQRAWLGFMSQYPVASGGVMTLIDQEGHIIARTLNNERWVGKPPSAMLLAKSRETKESSFRNVTLEGVEMYSAHSRSVRWGWTIATGIPAQAMEAALRDTSLWLLGAATFGLGLAALLALYFGRRIERPVADLGQAAHAVARGEEPDPVETGHISEVQEVAHAFHEASAMLRERERALNAALEGEQRARREAEQASAAKDEFLAMLGHELRNPLNALASATAVLGKSEPSSDAAGRSREIIERQIDALRELVDDLLDVARVTRGKIALQREATDLAAIARRSVAVLSSSGRLAQHKVDLRCEQAWVEGDETRLEQVVTNLVDNAVKYTPPGGSIRVEVAARGQEALLRVEDTGMGIPPELLPRVFDLFTQGERTLDRSQGGLGIGLALARRLVELHGGRIEATSKGSGRGSCFAVTLPLREAPPPPAPVVPSPEASERKLRILVVEDNPDGRETLVMMLGIQGHEVHEAEDGPMGVDRALSLEPDAAIVDIGLPGFDGYEVARRIRAAAKGTAIRLIALTGYGQEEDRQNAFRAGFDSFLVKPADIAMLNTILARV